LDVDSISKVVKMHVPSPPIETHSDDNIVGNWRLHSPLDSQRQMSWKILIQMYQK